MVDRKVVVGDTVEFIDQDGMGDSSARNGDVGVVRTVDSADSSGINDDLIYVDLTNRQDSIGVLAMRLRIVEDETTLDEAVKQCKNLKTEIQRLQLELNKYENILFKAGVKLI